MKEITNKVQEILKGQDKTYSRIIREYATVKDIPGNRELVEQYIREMRTATFERIQELVKPQEDPGGREDLTAGLAKLEGIGYMLPLIQAEINGAEDWDLTALVEKYQGTEWAALFHTLLKPRLRELRGAGPEKARLAQQLERAFAPVPDEEAAKRERFIDEIRTLQFFGGERGITTNIRPTSDGRFLIGNGERRNIAMDLNQAAPDFSVTGEAAEPIVKTRQAGKYTIREAEYRYKWNQ